MNTSESVHAAIDDKIIEQFKQIVGDESVLTTASDCWAYGYDNSRRHALAQAVVFAYTHDQVRDIVLLCNRQQIPLIARGKGTGTTGATVPDHGGIVLSLERMDSTIEIDPANRLARVQPGVTNKALQQKAAEHGFFWPPDPTSAAVCTIGGNLAYNSAGPRAVKYGTPRENTLGLRAITGLGEEINTGVITTKGVVGYDLTRLLIGSEGTLAIITEAVLKLTPIAEAKRTMQASYCDVNAAAEAVSAIMAQPVTPCALEFMDGRAIDMVRQYSDLQLGEEVGAILMIEVDGPAHYLDHAVEAVSGAAKVSGLIDLTVARSEEEVAKLWKTRKALSPALRNVAPKKINEDVVVPVSRIPELIAQLESLSQESGITIVNFGHAGNGNIHVNLLANPDDEEEMKRAHLALDRMFSIVLELGGTISGEHGIGLEKRAFVEREIDPVTLRLMHDIRQQFDPNGILNPGKSLPPAVDNTN